MTILYDNVRPGYHRLFAKRTDETYCSPFDMDSVMLFGSQAYGILDSAGQSMTTIQPVDPGVEIR